MNLKSAFFGPLSKPYYFMAVYAGPRPVAQERSLDGRPTYTRLLRKAFNISYKDHIPNITL